MSLITSNRKRFALVFVVLSIPTFLLSTAFISVGGDDGLKIGKNMPLSERLMAGIDGQDHSLDQFVKENGLIVIFLLQHVSFRCWKRQL